MGKLKSYLFGSRLLASIPLSLLFDISLLTGLLLVPFLIEGPQLIIGSFINFFLCIMALAKRKRIYTVAIMLPSIASILRGYIWGPFTIYLVYLMPFIWLGNLLLVRSIAREQTDSLVLRMVLGIIKKFIVLSISVFLLIRVGVVPDVLMAKMSHIQLFTNIIGGSFAYLLVKFINNKDVRYK